MITPLVGSDPQIFAGSLPPTQQKTRWSAAIPKYSWSYLKDCSNHEKRRQHWSAVILKYLDILGTNTCRITATRQNHQTNTTVIMITPLVGSDPQIFEHFSTKYLQDHCHQLKKKQWSTAIPKYSSSYLKDCSKHEKTDTTGRQWSSNICYFRTKYLQDHCHQEKIKRIPPWSAAIRKYSWATFGMSYLKDCKNHANSDPQIWVFLYQIFAGSLRRGKR